MWNAVCAAYTAMVSATSAHSAQPMRPKRGTSVILYTSAVRASS